MKMLYDPVRITQKRSSPSMPGSPIQAHDLKYLQTPCTFCLIFLHIVALTPGKCSFSPSCLQSDIDKVLLSKGSAHLGSESLRQSQHLIAKAKVIIDWRFNWMFSILQTQVLPVWAANTSNTTAAIIRWVLFTISVHFSLHFWEYLEANLTKQHKKL